MSGPATHPHDGVEVLVEVDWQGWIAGLAPGSGAAADRARRARAHARLRGIPVLSTRYLSRDPDDTLRGDPASDGARFLPGLGPEPGDALVTKHGPDLFDAPETAAALRRLGAGPLVFTGVLTEHGIARAAGSARSRGHAVTVLADACAGETVEAHHLALDALSADGVDVVTVADWSRRRPRGRSIGEVARVTGLGVDTLRWYEREGLLPDVPRDPSGRRVYDDAALRLVLLVVTLRRTGLPVRDAARFVALTGEGAASHGRRRALLDEHRRGVLARRARLDEDLAALEAKIAHYEGLIDAGLDCAGAPVVDPTIRARQRRTT